MQMTIERKTTGEKIKEARLKAGLGQVDAAAAAGITQSHWSHIERGSRGVSVETLLAISRALSVPIQDLLQDGQ